MQNKTLSFNFAPQDVTLNLCGPLSCAYAECLSLPYDNANDLQQKFDSKLQEIDTAENSKKYRDQNGIVLITERIITNIMVLKTYTNEKVHRILNLTNLQKLFDGTDLNIHLLITTKQHNFAYGRNFKGKFYHVNPTGTYIEFGSIQEMYNHIKGEISLYTQLGISICVPSFTNGCENKPATLQRVKDLGVIVNNMSAYEESKSALISNKEEILLRIRRELDFKDSTRKNTTKSGTWECLNLIKQIIEVKTKIQGWGNYCGESITIEEKQYVVPTGVAKIYLLLKDKDTNNNVDEQLATKLIKQVVEIAQERLKVKNFHFFLLEQTRRMIFMKANALTLKA